MLLKNKIDPKKAESERLIGFLDELLREEENKYCADCEAKQPRWASWNLGVFLCIRCAGLHRNLGVHISKVKSINLDSWTAEQVQHMRVMGNAKAKAVYEAELPQMFRRPQSDQTLESFIRAKYEAKRYILKDWVASAVNVADLPLQKAATKNSEFSNSEKKLTQLMKSSTSQNNIEKKDSNCNPNAQPILINFNETCDLTCQSINQILIPELLPENNQNNLDDLFGPIVSAPIPQSLKTPVIKKLNTLEKVYELNFNDSCKNDKKEEENLTEIDVTLNCEKQNQEVKKSTSDILALYSSHSNALPQVQKNSNNNLNNTLNSSINFRMNNTSFYKIPIENKFLDNMVHVSQTNTQNVPKLSNQMNNFFNTSNIPLTNLTTTDNVQSKKSEITASSLNDLFGQFKL